MDSFLQQSRQQDNPRIHIKKRDRLFPFARRPLLFGHRGCSKTAPENTFPAFEEILKNSIPGVELDIHRCASGELVVIHDSQVKRVTGMDGSVEDMSYGELRRLDAGSWFHDKFRGAGIPLLDEVLELLGRHAYMDIEIKSWKKNHRPLAETLVDTIKNRGIEDLVMVSSFDPLSLRELRRIHPHLPTAQIYASYPNYPWILRNGAGRFICRPDVLKPNKRQVNRRSMFFKSKIEAYPIITWTVDDLSRAAELISLGVDGIISNIPEQMKSILGT